MENPFSLSGKTVLVTGATSGIGRAIAQTCAQLGARVVVTGRSEERLATCVESLTGENHDSIAGDLTEATFRAALVAAVPKLDGFVLCAGIMDLYTFRSATDEAIDRMFEINLTSQIKLFRDLLQGKKINRACSIVTITSITGPLVASRAHFVYGATKAGLTAFSRGIAADLGSKKIRSNCIAPGMIATEGADLTSLKLTEEAIAADKAKYVLGDWGKPSDVANAAVYLLSDASGFVTGTTLVVDGGITLTPLNPAGA